MNKKIKHSLKIIKEAVENYPKIAVAVSFGKDSITVLELVRQINPNINCFTIITGKQFNKTLEFKKKLTKKWNLKINEYYPKQEVPEDLYKDNPEECCGILKVEPTLRAIKNLDCWITGLRKDEGETRKNIKEKEICKNIVKLNPIANWTEAEVWRYIAINKLPINPLYKKGYRSVGCEPCSKLGLWGRMERAGRWSGTHKQGGECGMHTFHKK
jgi:phosphoadenosine phosphosulfate reductase